ncbi:uncharacterized protein C6orf136 homolog [Eleutherodactylus coqui]|uniref:Uncharacterized protein n=1 Tax=Eleutherodactylus coqui TaxID=57060 RepID=A0A8J6K217_ELECQ|nr:hypothetical protein GDO78_019820 [Eleutherodactylus coqui]
MALCVRRLRGAPGLGSRWKSGIRGAGGAAGRLLRESLRVQDAILYRELQPCPRVAAPLGRPLPSPPTLPTCVRPTGPRMCLPALAQDKAIDSLRDFIMQTAPPPPLLGCPPSANHLQPEGQHLCSSQLDCFRSLFDVGVCRIPYQAVVWPLPPAPQGVLAFTPSQTVQTSKVTGSDKSDMEQHLALMHEKLRHELPKFLVKSLNYSLYRKDVMFVSDILHVRFRGLVKYSLFLAFTRLLVLSCFTNARISVLKLTSHPENNTIQARWSFTGLPLHALFYVFRTDKSELYRTYDAFSTFQLAPDGLICLHKMERVMPSPPIALPKKTILAAIALLALRDRPALNLLCSPKMPYEL